MDVVKNKKSTASGVGKCKEPDTPDLGSKGASAPSQKWVQFEGATLQHGSTPKISMGLSLHNADDKDEDNYDENDGEDDDENPPENRQGKEPGEDDPDYEHDVQVENNDLIPFSSLRCWTHSQEAQQVKWDEAESSLVEEILSDDDKSWKSRTEVKVASQEKVAASISKGGEPKLSTSSGKPSLPPDQKDLKGEEDGPATEEPDHQEPGKEGDKELTVKEVLFSKFNTKDRALMKALMEACDLCYIADNLTVQNVWGAIMGIDVAPTPEQVCCWQLFQVGPPGNHVVDDIHTHWLSYLYDFGA